MKREQTTKQWCLEEAAPQGSGIWREQRCKTWYLEEMAPLEQQCLEGREQWGGGNTRREQQHRTWHLEDVAPWGTSTCRQQRRGGMVLPRNGAAGEGYL